MLLTFSEHAKVHCLTHWFNLGDKDSSRVSRRIVAASSEHEANTFLVWTFLKVDMDNVEVKVPDGVKQ